MRGGVDCAPGQPLARITFAIKLTLGCDVLTVPACLSIVAVMFTIFCTHGQDVLVGVHQYTDSVWF